MIRWAVLLACLAFPVAAEPGLLTVTVTGVRNDRGHVLVAVCDRGTFLAPTCPYRGRAAAAPGAVVVQVGGVPPGVYAVQAFHDENDNGKLDKTFFGMPKEGMGFSRNAPMRFGPPDFADAAVTVPAAGGAVTLALRYFD
jgi:uncharacterized protein (DUF2141 family)